MPNQVCPHCSAVFLDIGDRLCPLCFKALTPTQESLSPSDVIPVEMLPPLPKPNTTIDFPIEPKVVKRAEMIIAGSALWPEALMCVLTLGSGLLTLAPLSLLYLLEWTVVARRHPDLLDRNTSATSLSSRFRLARKHLLIRISIGLASWILIALLILAFLVI